jgi:hypothetical protein
MRYFGSRELRNDSLFFACHSPVKSDEPFPVRALRRVYFNNREISMMANRAALSRRELQQTSGPAMRKAGLNPSSTPPPLAEMDEVLLDERELDAMLQRLIRHASDVVARLKRSADSFHHEPVALGDLALLLTRGEVFGAQVEYRYASGAWLDTLIVTSNGIRVVRMPLSSPSKVG